MSANRQTAPSVVLSPKEHLLHRRRMRTKSAAVGLLFLLPWLIGVACFLAYPLFYSLFLSFHTIQIAADGSGLLYRFVGFDNFKYAFLRDNLFPEQMFLFVREAVLIIPITVIFALLVAILLNQKFYGRLFFRTIFFLPVVFASGRVLIELFNQGQGDLPLTQQYRVDELVYDALPATMAEPILGILGKFIMILWFSGVQVIIFLAGFQTVSSSAYEAAQMDGATPWETFWKITFPSIVPFIVLNLIYTVVDLSTNPFNPILKHILANMVDPKTGYGYASALGWIYFTVILVWIGILLRLAMKWSLGKR
ncbi:carbohydrate ABC transporter permease [Paenibacillus sp. MBLB4367]|uniref:carbohydrate ABC transporter permease n=1 Tax=Paenibacillus sp. MBLB4367 TaxID=3384767 RepID=UPI0039083145